MIIYETHKNIVMQKVTLIHSVYLSHRNGANTVIRLLLGNKNRFANNGIEINGIAPDEISFSAEKGGIYAKIRKRISTFTKDLLIQLAQRHEWAVKKALYLRELRAGEMMAKRYIKTNPLENEVAFIHTLFTCYYYLKYRNNKQHVVLVQHTNGEPFKMQRIYYSKLEKSSYYQELLQMERYVLENVDRIVFVAKKPTEVFLATHPYVEPSKVFYVYNAVDNTEPLKRAAKTSEEKIEICCVASITPRKGQHYIIEALERIENKPNVHFTFIGEGSDRAVLEERIKNNGLKDYVRFVGVSNDVESYLRNSDAYILPSEDEGLPMAILEAMRASLPIISTPVGGIPEMLEDGYNGVIVQPSVESVRNFIENINTYDWNTMGCNSRKVFEEKFTVGKMVDEYSKILTFIE